MSCQINTINNESQKKKPIVRLHGCYYVKDIDLGLETETFGHDVFVVRFSKNKKRVKVKTITSIERNGTENGNRVFKKNKKSINYVELIHKGDIIVIPKNDMNTERLSGIYNKGIWVDKSKLMTSKYNIKYPKRYDNIIGK